MKNLIFILLLGIISFGVQSQTYIKKNLVVKNDTTDFATKLYKNSVVVDSNDAKMYLLPTGAEATDNLDNITDLIIIGDMFVQKTVLDSGDIKHLNSTPVTLVSAPATGYYLDIISVFTDYNYTAAEYTGDTSLTVYYTGLGAYANLDNAIDGSSDKMNKATLVTNPPIKKEAAILIRSKTSDPVGATATGTVTVYVAYRKVKL